jgi:hypothetical protein
MARPKIQRPALLRPTAPRAVHAPRIGWGGLALLLLAAGCAAGLLGWEALQEAERLEGAVGAATLEAGSDAAVSWLQVRALVATAIAGLCWGAAIHFGRASLSGWAGRLRTGLLAVQASIAASAVSAGKTAATDSGATAATRIRAQEPADPREGQGSTSRAGSGRPALPRPNSRRATNQDAEEPAAQSGSAVGGSLQRKNPLSTARGPVGGVPLRGGYSPVRHLPIPGAGSLLGKPEGVRSPGVAPTEPSGVRILASWRPLDASIDPEAAKPGPSESGPTNPHSGPSLPGP